MITEIPAAKKYAFSPLKSLKEKGIHKKLINVGGVGIMEEIGKLMEDKQIIAMAGAGDKCLLFVDLTDIECIDILNRAKKSYDEKLGKVINAE